MGDSGDCVEVVTMTVFKLWDIFGGTVNDKGYKVLDPHVKAIYGDNISIQRCEATCCEVDGRLVKEQSIADIRNILNNGNF